MNDQPVKANTSLNLDLPDNWGRAAREATNLGLLDATMNSKAKSETEVWSCLAQKLGGIHGRHCHSRYLRQAYGAGYNGIMRIRQANRRAAAATARATADQRGDI